MLFLSGRHRRWLVATGPLLAAALIVLPSTAAAALGGLTTPVATPPTSLFSSYLVNTKVSPTSVGQVERAIAEAGGTVIATYSQIGVIVARSASPGFADRIRSAPGVHSAGTTRSTALQASSATVVGKPFQIDPTASVTAAERPSNGQEPLEPEQWSLRAVKADQAAAINPGSADVTVGVVDTGVDDTHSDLAANFSAAQSASCVGGVVDTSPGAWRPYLPDIDYHGTHVAGEIAAARNGIGMAGVAPSVKVASIKVSELGSAFFYAESVLCAFIFAAEKGIEVTNNSYYVDPWLFNCHSDRDQGAVVEALSRAVQYSRTRGVLNIAAAGNANQNLASHALADLTSPSDAMPLPRILAPRRCPQIPTMLPGMVTVSATGAQNLKSSFSNYGLAVIDLAGPGGDPYQVSQTPLMNGGILSTMPGERYAFLQGTSMAAPHVAGVAALIKSAHPSATPAQIEQLLRVHADNPGCPTGFYDPDGNGQPDAWCIGGPEYNSFYGFGIVNALSAVST